MTCSLRNKNPVVLKPVKNKYKYPRDHFTSGLIMLFGRKVLLVVTHTDKKIFVLIGIALFISALTLWVVFSCSDSNPLECKNILLDPGHGGIDPGTNDGTDFFEKDINLQTAQKLKTVLDSDKAFVHLTRDSDISLDSENSSSSSRHKRDLLARVSKINNGSYDLFISIHVNHSYNSKATGPVVLYSKCTAKSSILANCVQDHLNRHIKTELNKEIQHTPVESDLFILNNSNIPGIIVETGFISNEYEKELLKDPSYQMKLSIAIYEGIKDFILQDSQNTLHIMNENLAEKDILRNMKSQSSFYSSNTFCIPSRQ